MQMKLLDLWDDADQHPISRLGFASRYHDMSTFAVPVSGGYVGAYVAAYKSTFDDATWGLSVDLPVVHTTPEAAKQAALTAAVRYSSETRKLYDACVSSRNIVV